MCYSGFSWGFHFNPPVLGSGIESVACFARPYKMLVKKFRPKGPYVEDGPGRVTNSLT